MRTSRYAVGIGALFALIAVGPAGAIFIPALQRPTEQQLKAERTVSYWEWTTDPEYLQWVLSDQVGGLALSVDYRHGVQDLSNTGRGFKPFTSEAELNTYLLRPEFVLTRWLSIYGIAALHDGTNDIPRSTADIDLDGWAVGAGVAGALGLRQFDYGADLTVDPFFVLPDFNWTHNDFDGIDTGVDVLNVTTRIGAGARTDRYNWGLYAGPMYQWSTPDLKIPTRSGVARVESVPENAWSGVVGAFFGLRLSDTMRDTELARPTVLATVEGGVGNRHGVLVSLRYEYDLPGARGVDGAAAR